MKKNNMLKGIGMVATIGCFFAIGVLVLSNTMQPVVEQNFIEASRERILVTGDGNPGDASGLFYIMIYPHSADPGTDYASNLSNASAYEFSDVGDEEGTGTTPKDTAFDIVVKVGVTDSDGYNGSAWQDAWHYVWMTCADLSISADTNTTQQTIAESANYGWFHYYMNNGGSGYTISENEVVNITSIKFYVYREV